MLFFMCCYCGVYPWGLLRPRSTKTAATVLMQVHSDRRTPGVPMRLSNCGCLPQNGPQNEPRSPAEEHRSFGRAARALPL
jgi:hypothetical protein